MLCPPQTATPLPTPTPTATATAATASVVGSAAKEAMLTPTSRCRHHRDDALASCGLGCCLLQVLSDLREFEWPYSSRGAHVGLAVQLDIARDGCERGQWCQRGDGKGEEGGVWVAYEVA